MDSSLYYFPLKHGVYHHHNGTEASWCFPPGGRGRRDDAFTLSPLTLSPPHSPSQPPSLLASPFLLPRSNSATLTISLGFLIIVNLLVCTEVNPLSGIMLFFCGTIGGKLCGSRLNVIKISTLQ